MPLSAASIEKMSIASYDLFKINPQALQNIRAVAFLRAVINGRAWRDSDGVTESKDERAPHGSAESLQ